MRRRKRINITVDGNALEEIDVAARDAGESRSAFLQGAALWRIRNKRQELSRQQIRSIVARVRAALEGRL